MPATNQSNPSQGVSNFGKNFLNLSIAFIVSSFILCLIASFGSFSKSSLTSPCHPEQKPEVKEEKKQEKKETPCASTPKEEPKKTEPAKFDESKWPIYRLQDTVNNIYLKPGEWSPIVHIPLFKFWDLEIIAGKNSRPLKSLTYYFPDDDYRFTWRLGEHFHLDNAEKRRKVMFFSPEGGWIQIKLRNF